MTYRCSTCFLVRDISHLLAMIATMRIFSHFAVVTQLSILFILNIDGALTECYFPDQSSIGNNSNVCDPSAENSACCYLNDSCVAGGYCFGANGYVYRYGCTDPTFQDPSCPSACNECEFV